MNNKEMQGQLNKMELSHSLKPNDLISTIFSKFIYYIAYGTWAVISLFGFFIGGELGITRIGGLILFFLIGGFVTVLFFGFIMLIIDSNNQLRNMTELLRQIQLQMMQKDFSFSDGLNNISINNTENLEKMPEPKLNQKRPLSFQCECGYTSSVESGKVGQVIECPNCLEDVILE